MAKLIYDISIDSEFSSNGEDLGIDLIACTKTPAILTKGLAFSDDEVKKMSFSDESKMRVIAPIMVPMHIYRFDKEGEYFVRFTEDTIEKMFKKFMANPRKYVFNYEHQSGTKVPAFILEAWIVEDPELDKSKLYNISVPKGTVMVIAQFTDKNYFENEIVKAGRTGFSIEGFLGMELIGEIKEKAKMQINKSETSDTNKNNVEMERKQKFEAAYLVDGTPVWISEKKVDGEVWVIDENMEKAPIFDGEHELASGEVIVTVDGKITEIKSKSEAEMAVDGIEEAETEEAISQAEVTAAADVPAEEAEIEKVNEEVTMALDEAEVMAIVQPKLDEIIQMIADLKAALIEGEVSEEVDMTSETKPFTIDQKFSIVKELLAKRK